MRIAHRLGHLGGSERPRVDLDRGHRVVQVVVEGHCGRRSPDVDPAQDAGVVSGGAGGPRLSAVDVEDELVCSEKKRTIADIC